MVLEKALEIRGDGGTKRLHSVGIHGFPEYENDIRLHILQ
jgi:hypothetical protein